MDSCSASHVEHVDVPHAHAFMFFNFLMYLLTKHTVAAGPPRRRRRMSAPAGLLEERLSVPKSKILADHKVGPADTCASLHVAREALVQLYR